MKTEHSDLFFALHKKRWEAYHLVSDCLPADSQLATCQACVLADAQEWKDDLPTYFEDYTAEEMAQDFLDRV